MDRTCVPEAWTRQFGSASEDFAWSVSVGSDGSVLVAGYTQGTLPGQSSAGFQDAFVRKYDAAEFRYNPEITGGLRIRRKRLVGDSVGVTGGSLAGNE